MPVIIPDEVLAEAGLSERETVIEIACRLFAAQILGKHAAGRWCGLDRVEFEQECLRRDIPLYVYTREMLEQDLAFARGLEADGACR